MMAITKTADMHLNILKSVELIARMKFSGTMEIGLGSI
jgi:hypothetical protein